MDKILIDSAVKKIAFNQTNNLLAVLSEDGTFRVLDANNLKITSGFKTNLNQEQSFRQIMYISSDLHYIAIAKSKTNQVMVLDVANKKIIYTVSKNSGEVETVFINNTNRYLICGGVDGRTYIFNLKNGHFLYNLPSHADYVTVIAMTNTTQLVATGSFDGVIYVTNLNTLKNPLRCRVHKSYIVDIEFLNKGKFISAEKDGGLVIYDFVQRKVKKRLPSVPDDITKMIVDSKREYAFVGTKLGTILVYDLTKEDIFCDKLYKYSAAVMDMYITKDGVLYIGLQNGSIFKEKLIDEEKYNLLLEQKNYAALYKELDISPFVIYSKAYQTIENRWQQTLKIAKDLLSQQKTEDAKKILEPFSNIPKKRTIIKTILSEFEEFEKFKNYVQNKRYSLAYPLTLRYKSFIDTKEYEQMERDWSKKFNKAQDIILDPRSDEIVKELLKDFRGIPSKTKQIQQLLKDKMIFNLFKKKLDSKDYAEIFNFIKQYPFLKETDIYENLTRYADNCYISLTKALSELNLLKAKGYIEILENFGEYEDDVKEIKHEMALLMQLTHYCKTDNMAKIYEIIDSLDYDIDLDCVKKYQKRWDEITQKADVLSYKGDTSGLLELFKNYFLIKSKSEIIKKYILSAYSKKLEYFMKKATKDDEKTKDLIKKKIMQLHNMFGYIEEIKSILFLFNSFYQDNLIIQNEEPQKHVTYKQYKEFFS